MYCFWILRIWEFLTDSIPKFIESYDKFVKSCYISSANALTFIRLTSYLEYLVMTDSVAPSIILVEPQLGENIGSVARVMLNYNLSDLRLVDPRDGWPNPSAIPMAAGAFDSGIYARVFESVEDAIMDREYLLATTARPRGMNKPILQPAPAIEKLPDKAGIIFGGEQSGLSNTVVAIADAIVTLPVNPNFASLNLSMAVGAICFAWGQSKGSKGRFETSSENARDRPANKKELLAMMGHLEGELEQAGYFFPPEKTEMMRQNLRNAFAKANWTEQEVRTFRGAIKALSKGRGETLKRANSN